MLLNIDLNRELITNHGLHLNGLGKDVNSKQRVSHIYARQLEEATISIKTVANRMSSRQTSIPVTRNEDFLW